MLDISIIGASGYTGSELLRLLARHPEVKITGVTSEQNAGKSVDELFPGLRGLYSNSLQLQALDQIQGKGWPTLDEFLKNSSLFFTALPHGFSMPSVKYLRGKGAKVIDLSADFRFTEPKVYEEWYAPHEAKELMKDAVYGLPEIHRKKIAASSLVAVPGCYPTAAILALAPLIKNKRIDLQSIIIDAKSGTSGAGRTANTETLFSEVNGGIRAYGVPRHRHTPEIEQELSLLSAQKIQVTFTPHLVPMARGILSCAYAQLNEKISEDSLFQEIKDFYKDEKFIRVYPPEGKLPDTKFVLGSYYCDIALRIDPRNQRVILFSAIDNLCRGASGLAIACMNLMHEWPENTGLDFVPLFP